LIPQHEKPGRAGRRSYRGGTALFKAWNENAYYGIKYAVLAFAFGLIAHSAFI